MKAASSLLYVPAASPSMLRKIPSLAADAFVIDLEDGVSAQHKEGAREVLREAAAARLIPEGVPWMPRVNGVGSSGHEDDLSLAEALRPPFVFLLKAEDPEEVRDLADWFSGHRSRTALMIETARGVAEAWELASSHEGVAALVVGSADLRLSLRAARPPSESMERLWLRVLAQCWLWREGIEQGPGLSDPDAPDVLDLTNGTVNALAVNPTTPSILYAGTNGGAFISTNNGGSWSPVNSGLPDNRITALAIDPSTPETLYAGTGSGRVFHSTNSGGTWYGALRSARASPNRH